MANFRDGPWLPWAERRGGRAGMAEQWDLDEEGIRRLGALTLEQPGRARPGA